LVGRENDRVLQGILNVLGPQAPRDVQHRLAEPQLGSQRKDVPFEMKINVNNVGSGSIAPQVIASGKLTVNKENLRVAFAEGEALKCDFNEAGGTLISSTTATLPATYTCYLVSSDAFTGYKTYTLSAHFTYTYQYSYTKVFTVLPTN